MKLCYFYFNKKKQTMSSPNEDALWKLAKKRAAFKRHLSAYVLVSMFLWAIWWFTTGRSGFLNGLPWPVWPMLGWGLGLAFIYTDAYNTTGNLQTDIEKEFEKLKRGQN